MIYTPLTQIAMRIAYDAHDGQKDKAGMPYIFHPFHLAGQMPDEVSCCVALLHDVMEDTDITEAQLLQMGIPDEAIQALILLTHEPSVPYMQYVRRLASNSIARKVKLADLMHNSDTTRLPAIDENTIKRNERYREAIAYLQSI